MKTHVLILSKTFPATHPKAGQPTYFNQKLMRAVYRDFCDIDVVDREWIKPSVRDRFIPAKLHTIRGNYERWKKIIDEVRSGEAILSVSGPANRITVSRKRFNASLTATISACRS